VFAADSSEDKDAWIELINSYIQQARKNLQPTLRAHRKGALSVILPPTFEQARSVMACWVVY